MSKIMNEENEWDQNYYTGTVHGPIERDERMDIGG